MEVKGEVVAELAGVGTPADGASPTAAAVSPTAVATDMSCGRRVARGVRLQRGRRRAEAEKLNLQAPPVRAAEEKRLV